MFKLNVLLAAKDPMKLSTHTSMYSLVTEPRNQIYQLILSPERRARMQSSPKALVSRDKIIHVCNLLVDIVESFTIEATKIVLIEDNFRSLKYFGVSFTVWTVAKYLSTKWIVGAGLLLIFSVPRLYLQHQEKIDAQLAKSSEQARVLANQYSEVARQRASGVYDQAMKATKRGGQSKKKVQ
jgi:hypothetical protein